MLPRAFAALAMLGALAPAAASTVELPQTGQQRCYDDHDPDAGLSGEVLPCAGTGQDGELQAGRAWPEHRFTVVYCDSAGPCEGGVDCDGGPATTSSSTR